MSRLIDWGAHRSAKGKSAQLTFGDLRKLTSGGRLRKAAVVPAKSSPLFLFLLLLL